MNSNTFFSNENRDLLYNLCKDELFRLTSYNIDENKKYYKTFGEIMKIVAKHSTDTSNLTVLNKQVLGKTIPYLQKEIEKKNLNNKPFLPQNQFSNVKSNLPVSFRSQATNIEHEKLEGLNSQYDRLMNERNSVVEKQVEPIDFSLENNNENLEKPNNLISNNLREREQMNREYNIPNNQNPTSQNMDNNSDINKQFSPNLHFNKQDMPSTDYGFKELNNQNPTDFKIENNNISMNDTDSMQLNSFNMPQDISNQLQQDNNLQSFNDDVDPMELYKKYNNERESEVENRKKNKGNDDSYNRMLNEQISFEDAQKQANNNIDNVLDTKKDLNIKKDIKFRDSLSFKMNKMMNDKNLGDIKGQLDERIENVEIPPVNYAAMDQTNRLMEENKLFDEFKNKLFDERKYINRENLIIINSADRDWFNDTEENRYNFQVRFRPERDGKHRVMKIDSSTGLPMKTSKGDPIYEMRTITGDQGCGLESIYKNIVSFELIRVLMPIENFIIPFDNRVFVDFKSLPYIVLKIDEIGGLYAGTNATTNNTFAKLLWDKDHTSEVVVNPTQESASYSNKYSRQFKRGFSSMAPMSFEKKTFYPSPLSSLNRLTISLQTPYGRDIYNHPDTLTVKKIDAIQIHAIADTTMEINDPHGFPYSNYDAVFEVEVTTFFSNRFFKIGDNIRFSGFTLDSGYSESNIDMTAFINREDGHYIINLQRELTHATSAHGATANSENEGFISKFYIPPPGDIDFTTGTSTSLIINKSSETGADTLYDNTTTDVSICKVINKSLQTHFVFKIVTREDDMTSVMNSSNV